MKTFKMYLNSEKKLVCKLDGILYRVYKVGELPNKFGYILKEGSDSDGVSKWHLVNGYTLIHNSYFPGLKS